MTPLLGTKTPSAPVGDKSGGERRAARSLLSCAWWRCGERRAARSLLSCAWWRCMGRLWRGMGGMGRPEPLSAHRPHRQQRLSGFHETRDTRPGYCQARGVSQRECRGFHETRDTNHGLFSNHGFLSASMPCSLLPTIARHCPALLGKKYCPASVSTPSAVLERPCGEITPPSGRLGLRRRQNEAMLRKENVLDSANREAFHIALTNTTNSLHPDALSSSLHFSPRGETKCVRGPSGRGASRAEEKGARNKAFKVFHESRNTAFMFFTNHETRNTNHGLFSRASTVGW